METNPLVSVVVPVYNAGAYFSDCLESIAGQTYENLEAILVDDGSTDGSSGMCDAFAKKDSRFRVIHQQNMGAASARTAGIVCASGKYICFVDADDKIDAEMIGFFIENIGECDLLTSGCACEDAPGVWNMRMDSFNEGVYNTKETLDYFISNMIIFEKRFEDGVLPFLVNKLYKTEIIKEVSQEINLSIVYAEDRDLLFRYILKISSVCVVHQNFYYYRYRSDSIMRMINKNFMSDLNNLYLSLEKAFAGHPKEKCLLYQLRLFILSRIYTIPLFMGFSANEWLTGYVFPFSELERESRIILYGAGSVGIRYYQQIHRQNQLCLVLWVDRNWKDYEAGSMPVSSPKLISGSKYDYIIIAVKRKELADEIRNELADMGVQEDQILWRPPAIL